MTDWEVCCDDSCKNNSRYMVYAGVMLPRELAVTLNKGIGKWRAKERLTDEIKWSKITEQNVDRFMIFAGGAMRYIRMGSISFACTVFDRNDRKLFRGNHHNERWGNLAFDFLLNCFALRAGPEDGIWIYPDEGMFRCELGELRDRLNAAMAYRRNWRGVDVVRTIKYRHSDSCHFVQMGDLFAGAVAADNNRNHNLQSRRGAAKEKFLQYAIELVGCGFCESTPLHRLDFKVWHYMPRIKKAAHVP
jgi:hypothetical protein